MTIEVGGEQWRSTRANWDAAARRIADDPFAIREVGIAMRDGVVLAADLYLPGPAERPAPTIVLGTPYGKRNPLLFVPEARFFQRNGYAVLVHDCRGRGSSEGEWRAYVHDGHDMFDVVEWTAAQEWSTGDIGTTGISYGGWVQWALAGERSPHLKAMISTAACGRWHEEIPYQHGVFQLYEAWWTYGTHHRTATDRSGVDFESLFMRLPVGSLLDELAPGSATWRDSMDHGTLDGFWQDLRLDERFAEIDVPCLHVAGWFDAEDVLGAFHFYEGMRDRSPARDRQRLLVGPWTHLNTRFPDRHCGGVDFGEDAIVPMDEIHLRFFDHWLKGEANGEEAEPPVRLFETGTNRWRDGQQWPQAAAIEPLFLADPAAGDGLAAVRPVDPSSTSYVYDPDDPVRSQLDFGRSPLEPVTLDGRANEVRDDVLVYTSPPVTAELCVSGWPRLQLFAASDGEDTEWHVRLADVGPDGRSITIASGCLRASCRDSLSDPTPLTPDAVHRFRVELHPVTHTFLPGHRLRVTVTSSDFPWYARSLNRFGPIATLTDPRVAVNTVHHGDVHASHLDLPIARGGLAACFTEGPA